MASVHDFAVNAIDGSPKPLSDYAGKVLVLVNVASKCGLTPQYADLELFYRENKARGIEVLGFPANNFGAQEPGTDAEIAQFCRTSYEVSFPMFSKISVKGGDQHPLYGYLTQGAQSEVTWNFQKFVVGKDGQVIRSFAPTTGIADAELQATLSQALAQ